MWRGLLLIFAFFKQKTAYEMQSFFIVNNEAATKARIRAFELAAKESAAAKMNAEQISKFIKEGFNN